MLNMTVRLWRKIHDTNKVISNAATPRIVRLYQNLGFQVDFLDVRRNISVKGDRLMAQEIFAFKEGTRAKR